MFETAPKKAGRFAWPRWPVMRPTARTDSLAGEVEFSGEVDFLPPWYPQLRRRRAATIAQAWATGALVLVLACWGASMRQSLGRSRHELALLQTRCAALTHRDEVQRRLVSLQSMYRAEQARLNALGPHVPMGQVLGVLQDLLPERLCLKQLKIDASSPNLRLCIKGVGSGNDQVAEFVTGIEESGCFSNVTLDSVEDAAPASKLSREFQVTLDVTLAPENQSAASPPAAELSASAQ